MSQGHWRQTHLVVLISREDLINSLLSQQIVLKVVRRRPAPCRWRRVHPLKFLLPFLPRLFLLKPLKFLELSLFFLLLPKLVQFLLLFELG